MNATCLDLTEDHLRQAKWSSLVRHLIDEWRRRLRWRRELADLDVISLRDICFSRSDAKFEAAKPFWMN
jgi:uncharacterized protein YjiS (DUF1127 family)